MVAAADYHNSVYAFCFAVRPSHRKQVGSVARPCCSTALLHQECCDMHCRCQSTNSSKHVTQGFGRRLMFAVEALAVERGFGKVSASVDSSGGRLLQHYLRLGGVVEQNSASLSVVHHTTFTGSQCVVYCLPVILSESFAASLFACSWAYEASEYVLCSGRTA